MPFVKISRLKDPFPRAKPKSRFADKLIAEVIRQALRNPATSGSVPGDVRLREAAGSDAGKKYKLSGMATPFGLQWNKTERMAVERRACNPDKCCNSDGDLRHFHDRKTAK